MAKFMLLIFTDPQARAGVSEEDSQAVMAEYYGFDSAVTEAGVKVSGEALLEATTAKTVGRDAVTDGPYAEISEHLGGYYLLDVEDQDAACAWAAKLPGVSRGFDRIEVRPVWEYPPEMPQ